MTDTFLKFPLNRSPIPIFPWKWVPFDSVTFSELNKNLFADGIIDGIEPQPTGIITKGAFIIDGYVWMHDGRVRGGACRPLDFIGIEEDVNYTIWVQYIYEENDVYNQPEYGYVRIGEAMPPHSIKIGEATRVFEPYTLGNPSINLSSGLTLNSKLRDVMDLSDPCAALDRGLTLNSTQTASGIIIDISNDVRDLSRLYTAAHNYHLQLDYDGGSDIKVSQKAVDWLNSHWDRLKLPAPAVSGLSSVSSKDPEAVVLKSWQPEIDDLRNVWGHIRDFFWFTSDGLSMLADGLTGVSGAVKVLEGTVVTKPVTYPPFVVDFSALHGSVSLSIVFAGTATGGSGQSSSWFWDFGDGGTDATQNPTHQYTAPGPYSILLRATDSVGVQSTITKGIKIGPTGEVGVVLKADFAAVQAQAGTLWVNFTDNTIGGAPPYTLLWDFGDPFSITDTSVLPNPQYRYIETKTYIVSLTATDSSGAVNTATKEISVSSLGASIPGEEPAPAPSQDLVALFKSMVEQTTDNPLLKDPCSGLSVGAVPLLDAWLTGKFPAWALIRTRQNVQGLFKRIMGQDGCPNGPTDEDYKILFDKLFNLPGIFTDPCNPLSTLTSFAVDAVVFSRSPILGKIAFAKDIRILFRRMMGIDPGRNAAGEICPGETTDNDMDTLLDRLLNLRKEITNPCGPLTTLTTFKIDRWLMENGRFPILAKLRTVQDLKTLFQRMFKIGPFKPNEDGAPLTNVCTDINDPDVDDLSALSEKLLTLKRTLTNPCDGLTTFTSFAIDNWLIGNFPIWGKLRKLQDLRTLFRRITGLEATDPGDPLSVCGADTNEEDMRAFLNKLIRIGANIANPCNPGQTIIAYEVDKWLMEPGHFPVLGKIRAIQDLRTLFRRLVGLPPDPTKPGTEACVDDPDGLDFGAFVDKIINFGSQATTPCGLLSTVTTFAIDRKIAEQFPVLGKIRLVQDLKTLFQRMFQLGPFKPTDPPSPNVCNDPDTPDFEAFIDKVINFGSQATTPCGPASTLTTFKIDRWITERFPVLGKLRTAQDLRTLFQRMFKLPPFDDPNSLEAQKVCGDPSDPDRRGVWNTFLDMKDEANINFLIDTKIMKQFPLLGLFLIGKDIQNLRELLNGLMAQTETEPTAANPNPRLLFDVLLTAKFPILGAIKVASDLRDLGRRLLGIDPQGSVPVSDGPPVDDGINPLVDIWLRKKYPLWDTVRKIQTMRDFFDIRDSGSSDPFDPAWTPANPVGFRFIDLVLMNAFPIWGAIRRIHREDPGGDPAKGLINKLLAHGKTSTINAYFQTKFTNEHPALGMLMGQISMRDLIDKMDSNGIGPEGANYLTKYLIKQRFPILKNIGDDTDRKFLVKRGVFEDFFPNLNWDTHGSTKTLLQMFMDPPGSTGFGLGLVDGASFGDRFEGKLDSHPLLKEIKNDTDRKSLTKRGIFEELGFDWAKYGTKTLRQMFTELTANPLDPNDKFGLGLVDGAGFGGHFDIKLDSFPGLKAIKDDADRKTIARRGIFESLGLDWATFAGKPLTNILAKGLIDTGSLISRPHWEWSTTVNDWVWIESNLNAEFDDQTEPPTPSRPNKPLRDTLKKRINERISGRLGFADILETDTNVTIREALLNKGGFVDNDKFIFKFWDRFNAELNPGQPMTAIVDLVKKKINERISGRLGFADIPETDTTVTIKEALLNKGGFVNSADGIANHMWNMLNIADFETGTETTQNRFLRRLKWWIRFHQL